MDCELTDFQPSDASKILKLHTEWSICFEQIDMSEDFIISSSARDDFIFFVAKNKGEIIGYIGALFFKNVGRAEIGPIAVKKGLEGLGLGKKMLEKMRDFLTQIQIQRICVLVKKDNKMAINFFFNNGFEHEAYHRGYTLNGEDVVYLVDYIGVTH